MTIYVVGPRDKVPEGAKLIDVTTRGKSPFSPMYNPCDYPIRATRMENAWQYSKVYEEHDDNGKPNKKWYEWREKGLKKPWADRYPMGKGHKPLYAWMELEFFHMMSKYRTRPMGYIEARHDLYIPLYKNMLKNVEKELEQLTKLCSMTDVALWDYDGYLTDDSFATILNNPDKKMGHAFVLREVIKGRLENE